ncbi:MAG: prephenate dehydrogenase/arogenate dehydrogenase family protein [Anaerolineae bacterium]|jgi:prephenate dehydrogenase|nr:prephenate dehydrogenase/arogenate dehydrogenase family protein [Anaerolineae bacterium]
MGFSSQQTVIVGLGLMGASLALALRPHVAHLVAVEPDAPSRQKAVERGVVDEATDDLRMAVKRADTVILCAPVRVILSMVRDKIGAWLRSNTLLIDIGSTKQDICEAMGKLPIGIQAVGGHPMTGKEVSGLDAADPFLYANRPWVICPTRRTTPAARGRALALIEAVGALPVEMEAERHDKVVAAISHVPYLLSASLVATVRRFAEDDPSVWDLAAGGFRDTSRLAGQDIKMMSDILGTNTQAVATLLAMFRVQLALLETMLISRDESHLVDALTPIREARTAWYGQYERRMNGNGKHR